MQYSIIWDHSWKTIQGQPYAIEHREVEALVYGQLASGVVLLFNLWAWLIDANPGTEYREVLQSQA
jgi:hypothetical protein